MLAFCLTLSQREFVTLLLDDKTYLGILAAIGQKAFGHPAAQNVIARAVSFTQGLVVLGDLGPQTQLF